MIYDHVWYDKPPLTYWALMICYKLFGISDFVSRIPNTLIAGASVSLMYHMVYRIKQSVPVAVTSAILLMSTLQFWYISHAVITDGFLFFFSLAIFGYAYLAFTNNDKTLISIPMYFGYCNTAQFLTQVYLGSSIYIYDGLFMPNVFFKIVQEEKITNFTAVPSILLMILNYRYHDKYDISSLKYIFFGGSSIPKQKLSLIMDKFSTIGFVQTYGQTEASPRITALLPCDAYRKLGSVGKPIKNVNVSIRDDAGNEVAQGQVGEVAVKGPNVMKGYYKREDITEQTIIDGWLYTGDLGFLDNEGYLYLTGRKKNMIISGGINIYPEEIEEILLLHQNVLEVCVLSESHPLLGEVPIAKIVLRDKQYVPDFKKYCEDKLAAYKIPTKFYFVDELEKTYNGKIKRRKDE